jgi:hypothetical protein
MLSLFTLRSGQTKDYEIGIYCFSAKGLRRNSKDCLAWIMCLSERYVAVICFNFVFIIITIINIKIVKHLIIIKSYFDSNILIVTVYLLQNSFKVVSSPLKMGIGTSYFQRILKSLTWMCFIDMFCIG